MKMKEIKFTTHFTNSQKYLDKFKKSHVHSLMDEIFRHVQNF